MLLEDKDIYGPAKNNNSISTLIVICCTLPVRRELAPIYCDYTLFGKWVNVDDAAFRQRELER